MVFPNTFLTLHYILYAIQVFQNPKEIPNQAQSFFLYPDDIPEDEDEFADSIQKEDSTSTRESSPLKETFLNKFSSKFSTSSNSGTQQGQPNSSVSINDGDFLPEKSSPTDQGIRV